MDTSDTTTVRIKRKSMKRIRIIAARRGLQAGVLINRILASRAALTAALSVLDEEEIQKRLADEARHAQNEVNPGIVR